MCGVEEAAAECFIDARRISLTRALQPGDHSDERSGKPFKRFLVLMGCAGHLAEARVLMKKSKKWANLLVLVVRFDGVNQKDFHT